jgi:FkbM family methyltransferase
VRALPRPPATFLDIGANQGFYTLLFAFYGYDVLAIEPMLLNRRSIKASLCANPQLRERVTLLPVALGTPSSASANVRCVVRADDRNAGNGKLSCSANEHCGSTRHSRALSAAKTAETEAAKADRAVHATICEPVRRGQDRCGGLRVPRAQWRPITLHGAPLPALFVAEANRKQIRQCLSRVAAEFGYRVAPTVPRHSSGELGDMNWILVRQQAGRAAGAKSWQAGATCTWASGCCRRHPRIEECTRKRLPSKK